MKWSRAVHHLTELADACGRLAGSPVAPLRVRQLWAAGEILGREREVETVSVALVVDLPSVPWLTTPPGGAHWAAASRMARGPFTVYWRADPVDNHRIVRPALVWDGETRTEVLEAIAVGEGERFRLDAPADPAARLAAETEISLAAVRALTAEYGAKRWQPGKLEPRADALWEATSGYVDLLDAS